jgi:hypothetical protein
MHILLTKFAISMEILETDIKRQKETRKKVKRKRTVRDRMSIISPARPSDWNSIKMKVRMMTSQW